MIDLNRATKVIGAEIGAAGRDAPLGRCSDLIIDASDGHIPYLAVNPGVPGNGEVLIARDRLAFESGRLVATVTPDEMARIENAENEAQGQPTFDLTDLPPLFVGPFGYTVSPALAGAVANDTAARTHDGGARVRPDIALGRKGWHWFSRLEGFAVFEGTESLGDLEDLVIVPSRLTCTELLVRDTEHGERAFQISALRTVDMDGASLVIERSAMPYYSAEAIDRDLS